MLFLSKQKSSSPNVNKNAGWGSLGKAFIYCVVIFFFYFVSFFFLNNLSTVVVLFFVNVEMAIDDISIDSIGA
jgi:hypothetical protein